MRGPGCLVDWAAFPITQSPTKPNRSTSAPSPCPPHTTPGPPGQGGRPRSGWSYRNGPLAQVSHHGCTANSRARAPTPPKPLYRVSRGLLDDWPESLCAPLPPPTCARCEGRAWAPAAAALAAARRAEHVTRQSRGSRPSGGMARPEGGVSGRGVRVSAPWP